MAYFAAIVIFGQAQNFFGRPNEELAVQFYINLWIYAILLAYLSVSWIRVKLGKYYLPLAIIFSTISPVFTNLIYLVDPASTDLFSLVSQSWLLFPILLIPLVITAWQYPMRYSVVFSFSVVVVELAVLLPYTDGFHLQTLPILGLPIIQGFAFGLVGSIVNQIMEEQRAQKRKVIQANVQLSEQALMLERMATVRERNRLARELHDTLAHTLSGLSVHLEGIKIGLDEDQQDLRQMIDHALENTRNGLDETRRTLKALRPRALEELGLRLSVLNLAQEASQRGSFTLNTGGLGKFPSLTKQQEQAIYRIVQEAFQNIIRHSNARHVTFASELKEGRFSLRLLDDGSGFAPEAVRRSDEFGIDGMKERARLSKGQLEVRSQPLEGTAVILSYEAGTYEEVGNG